MVSVVGKKTLRQQKKFFSDVYGNIFVKVWNEPNNVLVYRFLVVAVSEGLGDFLLLMVRLKPFLCEAELYSGAAASNVALSQDKSVILWPII